MKGIKFLASTVAALTLAAAPVLAAGPTEAPGAPVPLTDAQLDEVVAGESLLNVNVDASVAVLVQDINVNVDVFVPINAGVIAQINALGSGTLFASQTFPALTMP